jgi:hypothetical protein
MELALLPGDIFLTRNPMWLGRTINAVQAFWAADNRSEYSHAGIILNKNGKTFEALWTVRSQNLQTGYASMRVLIGRHELMNVGRFVRGMSRISGLEGKWYPFHRLFFHLFPPAAKYVSTGSFLVCSELTGKFLWGAGLVDFYKGKNPDHLADMVRRHKGWQIVFEGDLDEYAADRKRAARN